jgi:TrkA-C domain
MAITGPGTPWSEVTALVSVFIVLLVSLLVTRVATVALTLTGMSREAARFQARSAISGVGFTTSEAESVVSHPVRRRIVLGLMVLGSAGIVGAVASLMVSFTGAHGSQAFDRVLVLLGGILVLVLAVRSRWVDRRLSWLIRHLLDRFSDLEVRDYASLLDLAGEYRVMEIAVRPGDWVAGRTLGELHLRDEGVVVLGVSRGDDYMGGSSGRYHHPAQRHPYHLRARAAPARAGQAQARRGRRPRAPRGHRAAASVI